MQNVLTMHRHNSECDLCHVPQDIICGKGLALYYVVPDLLIQTSSICILHDYVDNVVFYERLKELDQCGPLEYSQELDFIFRAFFVFLIQEE